ncbi:hypothetical protein SMICM17S_04026 [Streptomyces microflavus]
MSRMGGLARRIPDAYWTMTVVLESAHRSPSFAVLDLLLFFLAFEMPSSSRCTSSSPAGGR